MAFENYVSSGNIWQSKTLFLAIFDPRSSIVLPFSLAAYPVSYRPKQSDCGLRDFNISLLDECQFKNRFSCEKDFGISRVSITKCSPCVNTCQ